MHCTIKPKSPPRQPLECMGASREGIVASPQSVGASCSATRVIAHRWSVQGERAFRWYRRKRVFWSLAHLSTGPAALFRPSRATAVLMDADNGSVDHLDGAVMDFEGLHDQVPDASNPPTNEPVVAGRIRSKAPADRTMGRLTACSEGTPDGSPLKVRGGRVLKPVPVADALSPEWEGHRWHSISLQWRLPTNCLSLSCCSPGRSL